MRCRRKESVNCLKRKGPLRREEITFWRKGEVSKVSEMRIQKDGKHKQKINWSFLFPTKYLSLGDGES